MGHTTHGLSSGPGISEEIEAGPWPKAGEPRLVADRGAAITWDGGTLPGIWLTDKAPGARRRARPHAMASAAVAIRRSHHIGCLAAFCAGRPSGI